MLVAAVPWLLAPDTLVRGTPAASGLG